MTPQSTVLKLLQNILLRSINMTYEQYYTLKVLSMQCPYISSMIDN